MVETTSAPAPSVAVATRALFLGILLLMLGNGLQGSLLGVRAVAEDFSTVTTGIVLAGFYVGFLAGSTYTTKALQNVGHIRVFAALASSASAAVLVHSIWVHPISWALIRYVTGFCIAGLYIVAESWLNDLATNETRGRLLSVYMIVTMGGLGGGQLLLNAADPTEFQLFVVASVLVSISLVPIALSPASAPPITVPQHLPFAELREYAPIGIVASFFTGMTNGGYLSVAAVYASSIGMSKSEVSLFVFAALTGAMALQFPIGQLSDRIPRRIVMLAVTSIAAGLGIAGALGPEGGWFSILISFCFGGMIYPFYSLTVAHTNDWVPRDKMLGASAKIVLISGIGAILGPIILTVSMAVIGDRGFFLALAAIHAVIGLFVAYRLNVRASLGVDEQADFVPVPARPTAIVANRLRPSRRPRKSPPR